MGSLSIWHWLIVLVIVLVLFGRGKVSEIMGDFGKGIKSFKEGMNEDEAKPAKPESKPAQITSAEVAPSASEPTKNEQA
ncbi:twin-arginine translocase TatA/TatE family subunit [Novosphingobium sp. 1949]|uniref:Sec-independent protein translocase protein TatA n=1 Tax=Novosphingobium organovorum TaxID=2930092 RepID=A0ABT0BIT6_9SPHN|nr:twin-arginine translocase TatA/TatE family subunit [Novosphingobium organovorum]MCJ2184956.1 twin-arginine translocase TatA/TatE family subunit [Novosphingobium organovorum]